MRCEHFNVLKIANIPFPKSTAYAASSNASYNADIPEYTSYYRYQIESYNDVTFHTLDVAQSSSLQGWWIQDRFFAKDAG